MNRRTVIATVGAIVGTSIGAAAYTSANVTRDATFTVTADSNSALVGLTAGTTNGVTNNGDKLQIALSDLNTDGSFTFGDGTAVDSSYAFSIVNNDTVQHTIDVSYDTAGVTFDIYTQGTDWTDATSVGTVDSATSVSLTAGAAEEFRVIITVDTTGVASGSTALNGTLTFNSN
jgi:hypothetical protein